MSNLQDREGSLPTNGCNEDVDDPDDGTVTPPHLVRLIERARGENKRAAKRAEEDIFREAEPEFRKIAAFVFGVPMDVDKVTGDYQHLSYKGEQFNDAVFIVGWDLVRESLHGDSSRYWSGVDSHDNPVAFMKHLRVMFKHELVEKRHQDHHAVDRRVWKRYLQIVSDAHEFGVFDESAIPLARERVKAGEYKGIISLSMFDRCWQDQTPLSIDTDVWVDSDEAVPDTLGDTLTSETFEMEPSTPEGRIAMDAFNKLGPRQQEQFARANGLWGDKESNVEIAESLGISSQGVSSNVIRIKGYLESEIEEYRFNAGKPRYKP